MQDKTSQLHLRNTPGCSTHQRLQLNKLFSMICCLTGTKHPRTHTHTRLHVHTHTNTPLSHTHPPPLPRHDVSFEFLAFHLLHSTRHLAVLCHKHYHTHIL